MSLWQRKTVQRLSWKGELVEESETIVAGSSAAATNMAEDVTIREERDASGKLLRTVTVRNGVPHGETVIYDSDGNVSYKVNYDDGVLSGPAEFFTDNTLIMIAAFANGKLEGDATFFNGGVKVATATFHNGLFEGDFTSFDNNGNIVRVAEYVNGKQHGVCQAYYADGTLLEQSTYKDGKLDGELVRCFPNGNVMEIHTYNEGRQYGYIDKYDIDGNLVSRTEV